RCARLRRQPPDSAEAGPPARVAGQDTFRLGGGLPAEFGARQDLAGPELQHGEHRFLHHRRPGCGRGRGAHAAGGPLVSRAGWLGRECPESRDASGGLSMEPNGHDAMRGSPMPVMTEISHPLATIWLAREAREDATYFYGGTRLVDPATSDAAATGMLARLMQGES